MKRILLASASVFAFAGAAAADHVDEETPEGISLTADALLGYNDEVEDGFFVEGDLGFTLAEELNNGLLVAITFGLGIEDNDEDDFSGDDDLETGGDFTLSLTDRSGVAGFHFGDTIFAAETHWDSLDLLNTDDFSEQDEETAVRGDFVYGDVGMSVSYALSDSEGDGADDIDQLSLGASGSVGRFNFSMGYQEESDAIERPSVEDDPTTPEDEEDDDTSISGVYDTDEDDDFEVDEVFAIGAGTTFGGFDVATAYSTNISEDDESLGFGVAYPIGSVRLAAAYIFELDDGQDDSYRVEANYVEGQIDALVFYEVDRGEDDVGIEADFQFNEAVLLRAGYIDSTDGYVGVEYDLGGGATILASYADQDEEGRPEYKEGTTVAMSFDF